MVLLQSPRGSGAAFLQGLWWGCTFPPVHKRDGAHLGYLPSQWDLVPVTGNRFLHNAFLWCPPKPLPSPAHSWTSAAGPDWLSCLGPVLLQGPKDPILMCFLIRASPSGVPDWGLPFAWSVSCQGTLLTLS